MKKLFITIIALSLMGYIMTSCATNDHNATNAAVEQSDKNEPIAKEKEVRALIHTDLGDIEVKLYNETPKHRDNFIKLAKEGYFNGTLFHRVINGFMIQGGDPDSRNAEPGVMLGNGGPDYTIPAEFMPKKYFHKRGALAAAREGDMVNPEKASSGSQFYIVQGAVYNDDNLDAMERNSHRKFTAEQRITYRTIGGTPHLDGAYTVFGEVLNGLDVVDKIAAAQRDANDRPLQDIKMSIKIIEE